MKKRWLVNSFFLFAFMALTVVLQPELREGIRSAFSPEDRVILSTASGDVYGDGSYAKILKIKTREGMFLEIYRFTEDSLPTLEERIKLQDKTDGYFMFNGEAANLALKDIDGDQAIDILVPSFDDDLVAHLNVFSYNKSRDRFIRLN